jgi:hypothetical protein
MASNWGAGGIQTGSFHAGITTITRLCIIWRKTETGVKDRVDRG